MTFSVIALASRFTLAFASTDNVTGGAVRRKIVAVRSSSVCSILAFILSDVISELLNAAPGVLFENSHLDQFLHSDIRILRLGAPNIVGVNLKDAHVHELLP